MSTPRFTSDSDFVSLQSKGGLYLPELDWWLDPPRKHRNVFVSHAHADHFARGERIFCSPPTAALIRRRFSVAEKWIQPLAFGEPFEENGFQIELTPAGHVLGSAMIKVTRLKDGASLLYTGDFKLRPGLSSEEIVPLEADTLVMETTFGLPKFTLPPQSGIHREILQWVLTAIEEKATPILHAYSLGKAQEATQLLVENGHAPLVHPKIAEMNEVYASERSSFPSSEKWELLTEDSDPEGRVILCAPNAMRSDLLASVPSPRTAMLSGWALQSGAKYRYRVDEIFPLTDHADYPDLLTFVDLVKPKRVLTLHGYDREFASTLRQKGIDARSLKGEEQLDFVFGES